MIISKKNIKYFFLIIASIVSVVLICDLFVSYKTKNQTYSSIEKLPLNRVGLLLGTSKFLSDGSPNLYYKYRIEAAAELFRASKIKYIVVSGDNRKKNYNEPVEMKNSLIKKGIPEKAIFLDFAGFRTFDSVIRINKIFGQESFTVISQKFHNERAIFLAMNNSTHAVGYNAKDVDLYNGLKTVIREKFARVKLFLDIIFETKPHFLGEPVTIE